MLKVDIRRMLTSRLFYIMQGIALVVPILIIVMVSMMEGSPMTDRNQQPILDELGNPVLMEGFKNVWQAIGILSTANALSMDLTGMCNMNLMYFAVAVFVCLFVADDFRSGYAKNIFAIRAKKGQYVASKTVACFVQGGLMILMFFLGSLIGGAVAGISFAMEGFGIGNLVLCLLCKMLLMLAFVPIFVLLAVVAKSRSWLSICLSLMFGMFLFMMIPMLTPLDATIINVILCAAGGAAFSFGLGAVSRSILNKKDIL